MPEKELPVDLTPNEKLYIEGMLDRKPNNVELGMFDILWSEHCSYKSSRPVLRLLPTKGKRVLVGPGYDAGAVDIGGDDVIVFKIESHNHPSAVEPYNGAATGIGGIIRDILSMGARPIALLDPLRFGSLKSGNSRWLFQYVVKGIGDYGNCVGIPTVAGEIQFDDSFERNCLVNVACVGHAKKKDLMLGEARKVDDVLILMGGSTGRDGIHGVTFASKSLSEKSEEDRPSVQIGDPFTKKMVIESSLEALRTGKVHGLKDLGGGGLTCASSEMAAKGGKGVEIEADKILVREEKMIPYELMLSESQERMLFVVDPNGVREVTRVFDKYDVPYSVIGKVTGTGEVVVKFGGDQVVQVPAEMLSDAPVVHRESKKPDYVERLAKLPEPVPTCFPDYSKNPVYSTEVGLQSMDISSSLLRLLSSSTIASKEWVYRQYDHEVGLRTVVRPGEGDAAVLRLLDCDKAIAVKSDCNSRHTYLDPYNGHAGAVAESARNVVAVGAEPIAMVDGCNFGNPEKPEVFWQFKEAIHGLSDMCKALDVPCVGGNVSFYNEDDETKKAVKPTAIVVMLGLIEDIKWVTTMSLKAPEDQLILIGDTYPEMGGSEFYHEIHCFEGGKAPVVVHDREKASIKVVMESIRSGCVKAAHDCSKGGLAVALALMAIKGRLGVEVELDRIPLKVHCMEELLYSESNARFILSAEKGQSEKILEIAKRVGAPSIIIGRVTDSERFILRWKGNKAADLSVSEMEKTWSQVIPKYMGVE
jgi:phosphoribosylformylglycinamidine synthase subunit PurL